MVTTLLTMAAAFAVVLAVELPDKTLVATLVLTTRYRALPVFVGVAAAFAVQCVVAAGFGTALTLLPEWLVTTVVAALFATGAIMLLRDGFRRDDEGEADQCRSGPAPVPFRRAALTSFGVLFAAEWGDASQLATAGLTARYHAPVSVGIGAWLALLLVAGAAVLVGRKIRSTIPVHLVQRAAGFLFAGLAVLALVQLVRG